MIHPNMSDGERQARIDLARLYRCFVHYGWTDFIYTHISARVPEEPDNYLINPYGLMFHEVTAGNLIKVTMEGEVIAGDYPVNDAGHEIHTAVLKRRPEINFAAHSHTRAGIAVSCMECGLLPLSQQANEIGGQICYHEYDDATASGDECEKLGADLGGKYAMIMLNHGLLTVGRDAGECFYYLYTLENACKAQVDILASGEKTVQPSDAVIKHTHHWGNPGPQPNRELEWKAIIRLIDDKYPDCKTL